MKNLNLKEKGNYFLPIIIGLIALLFSIDKSSIWIDEMLTYQIIHENSFSSMFANIWNVHNANGGTPLYFIFEWISTQFFGYSELGLRSLNIPFAIIYLIASWFIIRKSEAPSWFCILFFLHPLFIYYMNEARPYIILLSLASVYTYLLFYSDLNKLKTLFALHFLFLIGLLTHMMFAFVILMYAVHSIFLIRSKKLEIKKHLIALGIFAIPYLAILAYYMNIMSGAEELGGVSGLLPNWKASIVQIVYYFAGFGGIGLSRNDLRAMTFSHISWVHLTCMALMIFSYLTLFLYVIKNKVWKDKFLMSVLLSIIVTFGCFCVINILLHTRFWERHLIYLLPALLLLLCNILKRMINSPKVIYKIGAVLFILLTTISGIRTMFNEYYGKEDYKNVSAYIKNTKEATFFLQGDSLIYDYYGINLKEHNIQMINNLSEEKLSEMMLEKTPPFFLILSSRSEFDSDKLYELPSKTNDIKYNSFRIVEYIKD